jgi:hypothetical protein
MITNQGFPNISMPFVDPKTGTLETPWFQFLRALYERTGGTTGTSSDSGPSAQIQEAMSEQDEWRNPVQNLYGLATQNEVSDPTINNPWGNIWGAAFSSTASGSGSSGSLPNIANNTFLANISGALAQPTATTETAFLDSAMGSARGDILYRGAANWAALALGSNNQILASNGTDILWENLTLAMFPQIADATLLSNISGVAAVPAANSLTSIFDHDMGNTRGNILYRGAANWAALGLGSTGQMLRSNGTDITWASSIGYAGDQSYQTSNWASGTNFTTNCSFYTSATTQQSAEREILAGVFFTSTLGGNQSGSPTRDKVAFAGMIEGKAGSGDTWALYGVNVLDSGSMASTGYVAQGLEIDLNNNTGVNLSSPTTIGGHTAQATGIAITGASNNSATAALWITGTGPAGGPNNAQWDKGIWFTGGTAIGTACIVDQSQNAYYSVDYSGAIYQRSPINWNTGATATSATTGAQTLPANPAGFLIFYNGGTPIKIPYYNN